MRTYPQLSILYPRTIISIAVIVMLALAAVVARAPGLDAVLDLPPDLAGAGAAGALLVVAVAWLALRRIQAVVFTSLVMSIGALGTAGAMALFGVRAAPVLLAIAPFVMALGAAGSLYVAFGYVQEVRHEHARGRALRDHRYILSEAVRKVRDRVLLSSVVLCAGFAAMLAGPGDDPARLGLVLVAGTAASALAALTVVPAVIAWWPFRVDTEDHPGRPTSRLLAAVSRAATGRPRAHLAVAAPLVAVAAIAAAALAARGDLGAHAGAMLARLGLACGAMLLVMGLIFRSARLALVALAGGGLPAALGIGVLALIARPQELPLVLAGAAVLGICVAQTMYLITAFLAHRRYFTQSSPEAVERTLAEVGRPVLWASLALAPGFAVVAAAAHGALAGAGLALCAAAAASLIGSALLSPALLALARIDLPTPRQADIDLLGKFKKLRADELRKSFDDYTDDEILGMFTGDFLALSGKRVIRQGGLFGTRRLFYELEIKPGMKVLEIGTGVGASAFDVAEQYGAHVTSVDLSAYMVSVAQEISRARGLEDRITIMHVTDGDHYPFEDGAFDIVLVESIVMYANPDSIFSEAYRVLKPGGRIGFHDWSWPQRPDRQFEELTCVLACGCNIGDIQVFSKAEWMALLEKWNFHSRFAEEYPFKFFAFTGMRDDEGTLGVIRMFARVFKRRATIIRMMRMVMFLARNDGAFSYTLIVGEKPRALATSVAEEGSVALADVGPPEAAAGESPVLAGMPL